MRYFFFLLLIAASVGVFIIFINPQFSTIATLRTSLATYHKELTTAQTLQASREELIATYNSIQKVDLDNLKILLPDSVDNIRLIIQLDSLAQKNGLSTVRNVTYDADKSATAQPSSSTTSRVVVEDDTTDSLPYGAFKISFETTGQYKNFLSFLSDIEANLRLVDVTSVSFTPLVDKTIPTGTMTYKVDITTYWLKQ